ncbi:MAG: Zn-ribbon domain-containing OB-fold protein [Nitrososphaerota archaeon]
MNNPKDKTSQLNEDLKRLSEDAAKKSGLPIISDDKTKDPLLIDQRTLLLKYLLPVKRIMPFYDGLKRGEIMATKCKKCGAKYFPPQADCSVCYESEMEWFKIDDEGVLLTYTQINVKPASFSNHDDYIIGIAKFQDDIKILARVIADGLKSLRAGMRVKLVVTKNLSDDNLVYIFKPL